MAWRLRYVAIRALCRRRRDNLARWEQTTPIPWVTEWCEFLDGPLDALLALLESPDENTARTRFINYSA